jgi:hypothetical protein
MFFGCDVMGALKRVKIDEKLTKHTFTNKSGIHSVNV